MLKEAYIAVLLIAVAAPGAELPENSVVAKYQYFEDNNGVYVHQPMVKATHRLTENTAVYAHFLIDGLTAASRRVRFPLLDTLAADSTRRVKNVRTGEIFSVDAVTSASQREIRQEYGAGVTRALRDAVFSVNVTKSMEKDYSSFSFGGGVRLNFFEENTNLILSGTRFNDDYDPIENNNGLGGLRKVNSLTAGLTQTLTPRTIAALSYGFTGSWGFLGRPYYQVLVQDNTNAGSGGTFYLESYPETRSMHAAVAKLRQHYPSFIHEGSIETEYRRYKDNWGLQSWTYSLLASQYLHRDFILELRYRYYTQSGVAFYRDRYTQRNLDPTSKDFLSYLTADPRLSDFNAHLFCVKGIFLLRDFFKPETPGLLAFFPTRLDLEVERYLRATDPDPVVRRRRYEYYDGEGLKAWLIRAGLAFNY